MPDVPLDRRGWIYSEGSARVLEIDLTSRLLPQPRLAPAANDAEVVHVPAYTDFRLQDITDPDDADAGNR